MKYLIKTNYDLSTEGRWDIDYHLPPELIAAFPKEKLTTLAKYVTISKVTKDPSKQPEDTFIYVDIASVDVLTGTIVNSQELTGEEAPSRARMLIKAFDVILSTVRPTRGAVAVVPPSFHNQICSTGFCVIRCHEGVNPYFIHFLLRTPSTLEQFRKFSTGSSYPAILDSDALKVIVPDVSPQEQDAIARSIMAVRERSNEYIRKAKEEMEFSIDTIMKTLQTGIKSSAESENSIYDFQGYSIKEIQRIRLEIESQSDDLPLFSADTHK